MGKRRKPDLANEQEERFNTLRAVESGRAPKFCPTCDQPLIGKARFLIRIGQQAHLGAALLLKASKKKPDLRPVFTIIPRPAGLVLKGIRNFHKPTTAKIDLGVVFSAPVYRIDEVAWNQFIENLRKLVHTIEDWRAVEGRSKTIRDAKIELTRGMRADAAWNRFYSGPYAAIAHALWTVNLMQDTVFFDPIYFSREHEQVDKFFWRLVDLVRRLYGRSAGDARGNQRDAFTEEQLFNIARGHEEGLGDMRNAHRLKVSVSRIKNARLSMGLRRLKKKQS